MKVLLLLATALPFIACQVLGGQQPYDADANNEYVVFALKQINDLNKANGDSQTRVIKNVVSATSQVVAGVIYKFTLEVSGGSAPETCTVAVWSRPWLPAPDSITLYGKPTCVAEKSAAAPAVGGLVGGEEVTTLSDPDVQKAVKFLEDRLNDRSNSLSYLKATGVSKVTKQVVNGINFHFYDVTFAESTCTKNDVKLDANKVCTVSTNALVIETCTSVVYWNPRATPDYSLTTETCK